MTTSPKMHEGEAETDPALVRRLLRAQFPQWAALPIRRLASGGTVNALYRVGPELTVRLPLLAGGARTQEQESRWLPVLAPRLPVPIPEVLALGTPAEGYPWPWSVHRWIEGDVLVEGAQDPDEHLAHDLAAFVTALRALPVDDVPPAHRGHPLADADAETRAAIEELRHTDEPFDADTLLRAWEAVLEEGSTPAEHRWIHSDLMPSNLLGTTDGRLAAVIDFETAGTGDPAVDLIPAWNLLTPSGRETFRAHAGADEAAWTRSRGWALSMAATQLPYYRHTNPVISANARYTLTRVLSAQSPA